MRIGWYHKKIKCQFQFEKIFSLRARVRACAPVRWLYSWYILCNYGIIPDNKIYFFILWNTRPRMRARPREHINSKNTIVFICIQLYSRVYICIQLYTFVFKCIHLYYKTIHLYF